MIDYTTLTSFRIEKLKLKYATILEIRNDLETKFEKLEEVIAYSK